VRSQKLRNRGKYLALDIAIVTGFFATVIFLLHLIHGGFGKDFAYSALLGILGMVLGLVIALVITPFTAEEGRRWTNLTSALAGAAAGYGAGTLDDSISYVFRDAHFLKDPILGTRVAIFVVCVLFGLIYGFSYRRYYVGQDLELDTSSPAPTTPEPNAP
jgi:hypothetical protein